MVKVLSIAFLLISFVANIYSQDTKAKPNQFAVFIENKGQIEQYNGEKVLFLANTTNYKIVITKDKIYTQDLNVNLQGNEINTFALPQNLKFETSPNLNENEIPYLNLYVPEYPNGITKIRLFNEIQIIDNDKNVKLVLKLDEFQNLQCIFAYNASDKFQNDFKSFIKKANQYNSHQIKQSKYKDAEIQKIDNEKYWLSFYGGNGVDVYRTIDMDSENSVYCAGASNSPNIYTSHVINQNPKARSWDQIITKYSSDNKLVWATMIGSSGGDVIFDINVRNDGQILAVGEANNADFPLKNPIQQYFGGGASDGTIIELNPDGSLAFSSYWGGNSYEGLLAVVFDETRKRIWICGQTDSGAYPVDFPNCEQCEYAGASDGNILCLDYDKNVLFADYFGTKNADSFEDMTIDEMGFPIFVGWGGADNKKFDMNKVTDNYSGSFDIWLVRYNPNTFREEWGMYLGGDKYDVAYNVNYRNGKIALLGNTSSNNIPISKSPFQESNKNGDYYIAQVDTNGSIDWSTFFGGNNLEGQWNDPSYHTGIDIDSKGNIFILGMTKSNDLFTTNDAFQKNFIGNPDDAIFARFNNKGQCYFSTYLGGKSSEWLYDVAISRKDDNIFAMVGWTSSSDFPVTDDAFQKDFAGGYDAFVFMTRSKSIPPLKDTCNEYSFKIHKFTNNEHFRNVGSSYIKNDYLVLTENKQHQSGAYWTEYPLPVHKGFITNFAFRMHSGYNNVISESSIPGADGFAFVIRNSQKTKGQSGGGIGFAGIPNSVAVEIDTYHNASELDSLFDPNGNHIAIFSNGALPNTANHKSEANLATKQNILTLRPDSTIYYARIEYDYDNKTFAVALDTVNPPVKALITLNNFDLSKSIKLLGEQLAWVGITSSTGSAAEFHEILAWDFCSKGYDIIQSVDEYKESKDLVYPNPSDSYIFFDKEIEIGSDYKIIDVLGAVAAEGIINDSQIDISMLSSGTYFLIIISETQNLFHRIVKY